MGSVKRPTATGAMTMLAQMRTFPPSDDIASLARAMIAHAKKVCRRYVEQAAYHRLKGERAMSFRCSTLAAEWRQSAASLYHPFEAIARRPEFKEQAKLMSEFLNYVWKKELTQPP